VFGCRIKNEIKVDAKELTDGDVNRSQSCGQSEASNGG
jgi:hypothetical protein